MPESIERLFAEGTLRYSQVWEDHLLVEDGLKAGPGDDVLSIASAGCNVLGLLLRDVKRVVAIDLNPSQLSVVELKLKAIEHLTHEEFVNLFGIREGLDRLALYEKVRPHLSERARTWCDIREGDIKAGLHWSGRLEAFFKAWRVGGLQRVHTPEEVETMLSFEDLAAQTAYFDDVFANEGLKREIAAYFTVERIGGEGRDQRQMRYVAGTDDTKEKNARLAKYFFHRFRTISTSTPSKRNCYLESLLTGRYRSLEHVQTYLHPANYDRLKSLIPRVELVNEELGAYVKSQPEGALNKANLSDLFEYLDEETCESMWRTFGERFRPAGRIIYWNLFVPRSVPAHLHALIAPREEEAKALYARDRALFYSAFHIDEVQGR
jgi:S-adenosylmethionine-diacylglycerol 3-amino-3-carboxypropyl transferase